MAKPDLGDKGVSLNVLEKKQIVKKTADGQLCEASDILARFYGLITTLVEYWVM